MVDVKRDSDPFLERVQLGEREWFDASGSSQISGESLSGEGDSWGSSQISGDSRPCKMCKFSSTVPSDLRLGETLDLISSAL